jgi:hypothetical protein
MTHEQKNQPNDGAYSDEIRVLLDRAQRGDQTVLPALKELLDERPELWREFGNLAWHAEQALLNLASGKSLLAREAIGRKLAELRSELAGATPPPLEKLLVDRIVLCWLHVHLAELDVAGLDQKGQLRGAPGREAQQRLDRAHHRFLSSIKQLTTVRKLLQPSLTPLELLEAPVSEKNPTPSRSRRGAGLRVCSFDNAS